MSYIFELNFPVFGQTWIQRCSFTRSSNLERGVPLMKSITGVFKHQNHPKGRMAKKNWCDMCDAFTCLKPCGLPCPGSEGGQPLPRCFFFLQVDSEAKDSTKGASSSCPRGAWRIDAATWRANLSVEVAGKSDNKTIWKPRHRETFYVNKPIWFIWLYFPSPQIYQGQPQAQLRQDAPFGHFALHSKSPVLHPKRAPTWISKRSISIKSYEFIRNPRMLIRFFLGMIDIACVAFHLSFPARKTRDSNQQEA